jgi:hypothetical protein
MIPFSKKNTKMILIIISITLFLSVFAWIHYLTKNNYIVECFESIAKSHTVNLPLTTKYSCKNFCGPTARCSITGHQCTADVDCPGCEALADTFPRAKKGCIPGDNDAGKLTWGVTPQYSTLTTDIGTQAAFFTSKPRKKPAMANFGVNTWYSGFKESQQMFDKRYKPPELQFMPTYQKNYSATGMFIDDGPLASNAYISIK